VTIPFEPADAAAVLRRTPGALRALLAGLPERWLHAYEGDDTFSPWEVVAHLLSGDEVGPWRAYLPVLSRAPAESGPAGRPPT